MFRGGIQKKNKQDTIVTTGKIRFLEIKHGGQIEHFMTESPLRYDDSLRDEGLSGHRLNFANITSIHTEYTTPLQPPV